jgi:hypothetical protein
LKRKLSKGEKDFIKGCTKAILNKDTSHVHWLFVINGVRSYISHKEEKYVENHPVFMNAKCLCIIGEEFISNWHNKAGNDDFSKPWVKKNLENLLINSESVADIVYNGYKEEDIDILMSSVRTDGLSEKGENVYLEKLRGALLRKK